MRSLATLRLPPSFVTALLVAGTSACGGKDTGPTPPPPPPSNTPASITVSAGDGQVAAAGTAVPVRPAVLVRNAQSQPVAGVSVQFAVAEGGGVVTGEQATTDASGLAQVGEWTLGESGAQRLSATVGSLAASFQATLTPGTETITSTIGPTGGLIQVAATGHPLNGLSLTVPAGTFGTAGAIRMRIAAGVTAPTLPAGYRVAGPIVEVHTAEPRGARLMTVRMPVTRAADEDVVLVLHDPVRRVTEVLPTVARDAGSVTAMTGHLRADLLLGPVPAAAVQAAAPGPLPIGQTGWLMPVVFSLPQPPVTLTVARWPVLDHGSARSPNGFGPAIPSLVVLSAAQKVQNLTGRIKGVGTPGFYAEAAPLAAASTAQAELAPKLQSAMNDLLTAIQPLTKAVRDEMLHRNQVASLALSTEPTVTALLPSAPGGPVVFANGVAGSETSIEVVPPGLAGIAAMARSAVSGYASTSVPVVPDQPPVTVESAAPLSSFVVAFEDIKDNLADLIQVLDQPARSAQRKAMNKLMAQAAGLIQPALEVQAASGHGWFQPDPGPIPLRTISARLRSTNDDPPALAVHAESGAVVVAPAATPVAAQVMAVAQPVGQPTTYVVSGVQVVNGKSRQTAPVEEEVAWVPFQVVPDNYPLVFGASQVTFDAAVPFPPQGGYRIRWDWGDSTTTVVTNAIRAIHDYAQVRDRRVIATLLPASGTTVLAADTVTVSTGQPYWQITGFTAPDPWFTDPLEPGETDHILRRIVARPEIGLIGLVAVPGGNELRLWAKSTGIWDPADCCPPTFVPADESLLLGPTPEVFHNDLGPLWAGWRHSARTGSDVSTGFWTGRAIGPKRTFVVKDGGTQVGTEYGIELVATADGTSLVGTLSLTIWGINEDGEVEQDSEHTFRLVFTAKRLR
ncbi:MAG: Ig-like domain-containing protein [Gemmatimonadales bacterium]|nr:Ig-like domain-containing protein [Gemmatimonadales bacterium]